MQMYFRTSISNKLHGIVACSTPRQEAYAIRHWLSRDIGQGNPFGDAASPYLRTLRYRVAIRSRFPFLSLPTLRQRTRRAFSLPKDPTSEDLYRAPSNLRIARRRVMQAATFVTIVPRRGFHSSLLVLVYEGIPPDGTLSVRV